ncbi:unnamed protein product [Microthlaspi erraticum]|uniref:glucan endo-1,3-beta-D-glucosidase n=1 Tax=Microthlaspi erraticum TaxID=1685480 RepID=A0A6D2HSQ0_9BRAS|nr:unnamed protein product [Microthlaspi erraticum]
MQSVAFSLLLLISITATAIPPTTSAPTIGGAYSSPGSVSGSVLLSPNRFAEKIVSRKIPAVRLLDSDRAMIRAFANTNVSLFLSVPIHLVPRLASDRLFAKRWVKRHVLPFYPLSKISTISVGYDAASHSPDVSPFLLGAMQNVHRSLTDLRIFQISVSTTFSFLNIVTTIFPPSAVRFKQEESMRPILRFIERTNSSFLINLYPVDIYRCCFPITVGFALFSDCPLSYHTDLATGLDYRSIFDVVVDSVITSMAVMGHADLPLIVAETGWPSSGTHARYSDMFYKALLTRLRSGSGTPLRKEPKEVYILELDHNMASKSSFEV